MLPTTMSVATIKPFVKAVSITRIKKEPRAKKDERRKSQKPEFLIIIAQTRSSVNNFLKIFLSDHGVATLSLTLFQSAYL